MKKLFFKINLLDITSNLKRFYSFKLTINKD